MDIGFFLQRQNLRPGKSCIQCPAGDAHGQHGIEHAAAEDAGDRDRQHHLGKGQQNIRQTHDQAVRMTRLSTAPPYHPAIRPSAVPAAKVMATSATAEKMEVRDPISTREQTQRP